MHAESCPSLSKVSARIHKKQPSGESALGRVNERGWQNIPMASSALEASEALTVGPPFFFIIMISIFGLPHTFLHGRAGDIARETSAGKKSWPDGGTFGSAVLDDGPMGGKHLVVTAGKHVLESRRAENMLETRNEVAHGGDFVWACSFAAKQSASDTGRWEGT